MADEFDPFAGLDPIARMKLQAELEGRYATPEDQRANGQKLREMALESLLGGRTLYEMGRDVVTAGQDEGTRGGLREAALAALEGGLALVGSPFSRSAENAAHGATSRANVFLPIGGERAAAAKEMRDAGMGNDAIYDKTRTFFTHEGVPARQIDDSGLKINHEAVRKSGETPLGDLIDHPELFAERPHFQDIPVLPSRVLMNNGRPLARTTYDSDFSFTPVPGMEQRGDIAKLMQYRIAQEDKLSPAVRHGRGDVMRAVEESRNALGEIDTPAAAAYRDKLEKMRTDYEAAVEALGNQGQYASPDSYLSNRIAGNVNSKQVRRRAIDDLERLYPYSRSGGLFGRNKLQKPAAFEETLPMLTRGMSQDDVINMLADWQRYGSGKGP